MSLEVVRGTVKKIQPTKNLVVQLTRILEANDDNGTLYLGYPLTANADTKITIDALLVSNKYGLISFIFPEDFNDTTKLKEEQDSLYYQMDYNFKKYPNLRKGRGLAFDFTVITIFPEGNIPQVDGDYIVIKENMLNETINSPAIPEFNPEVYSVLCEALQRVSNIKPRKKRENVLNELSKGGIIKKIEKEIANLDQWQKKAALEIPDGPQRIRGLAGSGKTIVLALKAAYLHTQNPEWKIAVTFYTRSLSQQYYDLIRQFCYDFSGDEPNWENLHIVHSWGTYQEKGIYSIAASMLNQTPLNYGSAESKYGRSAAFEGICKELLHYFDENFSAPYDALLIDEAQDMPISFFKIAYQLIKPPKRLTWAYDELQNLSDTAMPSLEEMFGVDDDGNLLININNNPDEAQRDIVLPVCYRNPPWTLAMAHALGFGIYRNKGKIQMFDDLKVWEEIGYKVENGRLRLGSKVVLSRKPESTPTYFYDMLTPKTSIESKIFESEALQFKWVADQIHKNIEEDELDPDDILVVFPNALRSKSQYSEFRKFLIQKNIASVLVGVNTDRETFRVPGHVSCSGIYRAKGNESPMVYIVNSDYCSEGFELIKLRNILFTSITRSRGWVRICGVGSYMELLNDEIQQCIDNDYSLDFKLPTDEELAQMRRINRERSEEEIQQYTKAQRKLKEIQKVLEELEENGIDPESLPEFNNLLRLFNNSKKSVDEDEAEEEF
ncbi:UvrD/REP helicase [compost metagenome]